MPLIAWLGGSLKTYWHCVPPTASDIDLGAPCETARLYIIDVGNGVWAGPWASFSGYKRLPPLLQPRKGYNAVVKKGGSDTRGLGLNPGFQHCLCGAQIHDLTSLSPNLFICKAGIGSVPTPQVVVVIKQDAMPGSIPAQDALTRNITYYYLWCLGWWFPIQIHFCCLAFSLLLTVE